jgi:hypothetical protein
MQVVQKLAEAIVRELPMLPGQPPRPNRNEIVGWWISGVSTSCLKISRRTSIKIVEFRRIVPFHIPKVPATKAPLRRSTVRSNNQTELLKGDYLAICLRHDPVIFNISSVGMSDLQIMARHDSTAWYLPPFPVTRISIPDLTRFGSNR